MVAKISMGSSLYGALAYNGEKINEARGKLLATNKIYNDGTGTVDIGRALNDFLLYMPSQTRVEKPVVHISLNPHPEDRLTRTGSRIRTCRTSQGNIWRSSVSGSSLIWYISTRI